jgi:hypothetical protein
MKTTRLLLALLVVTTGAIAQDKDNHDAKLALAREAIAAMKADKMFDGMMAQVKQMASPVPLPAEATPEQRQRAEAFRNKILDLSMESAKGMIAQMDQLYADIYSEAELKAMVAFFKSPEGQSMLAKQPQVMQRVMVMAQAMQRDLMPKMQQMMAEMKTEMKAEKDAAKAAETPPPAK